MIIEWCALFGITSHAYVILPSNVAECVSMATMYRRENRKLDHINIATMHIASVIKVNFQYNGCCVLCVCMGSIVCVYVCVCVCAYVESKWQRCHCNSRQGNNRTGHSSSQKEHYRHNLRPHNTQYTQQLDKNLQHNTMKEICIKQNIL